MSRPQFQSLVAITFLSCLVLGCEKRSKIVRAEVGVANADLRILEWFDFIRKGERSRFISNVQSPHSFTDMDYRLGVPGDVVGGEWRYVGAEMTCRTNLTVPSVKLGAYEVLKLKITVSNDTALVVFEKVDLK